MEKRFIADSVETIQKITGEKPRECPGRC